MIKTKKSFLNYTIIRILYVFKKINQTLRDKRTNNFIRLFVVRTRTFHLPFVYGELSRQIFLR